MLLSLSESALPVRLRLDRALSDAELMRFSAENLPLKVEREPNGELTVMPPTGSEGASAEAEAMGSLWLWARSYGRGKVFGPTAGFTLRDGSVLAADAAWVSWACWNGLTAEQRSGFAPICPEFVIEIRSKSDRLGPIEARMAQWVAYGAELAWMVDPERRVVAIYRPGAEIVVHQDPSSVAGDGPVRGFELVMAGIWG